MQINRLDLIYNLGSIFRISLEKIEFNPFSFSNIKKGCKYRKLFVRQFPYKIYYYVKEQEIIVIAIIHTSRSNTYIKRRLK